MLGWNFLPGCWPANHIERHLAVKCRIVNRQIKSGFQEWGRIYTIANLKPICLQVEIDTGITFIDIGFLDEFGVAPFFHHFNRCPDGSVLNDFYAHHIADIMDLFGFTDGPCIHAIWSFHPHAKLVEATIARHVFLSAAFIFKSGNIPVFQVDCYGEEISFKHAILFRDRFKG